MTLQLKQKATLFIPSPLHPDAYTRARELGFDVLLPQDLRNPTDWLPVTDAMVLRQGKIPGDIREAQKLKIIARNGTGYDMIDTALCKELAIAVTNLPGFNAEAVAEHCLAIILSLNRRLSETMRHMRAGKVLHSVDYMGLSLSHKTVGLVGMGNIARELARKLTSAFNCIILVYSPTSPADRWSDKDQVHGPVPHTRVGTLEELLKASDVVSLHAPLIPETRHLISTKELTLMKDSAILVNLARGPLVDEAALLEALKNKTIRGAGVDVYTHEPATMIKYSELFDLDNVVFTPHTGATTMEVTRDSTIKAVEVCAQHLNGDIVEHRVA